MNAIALLAPLLLLSACAGLKKSVPPPTPPPAQARAYEGVLPCPLDCAGVRTELSLFDRGRRFRMKETYMGVSEGDRIEISEGEWSVLKGHGGNPSAVVYELTSETLEEERYFLKSGEKTLRALDSHGKEIPTRNNVTLQLKETR